MTVEPGEKVADFEAKWVEGRGEEYNWEEDRGDGEDKGK